MLLSHHDNCVLYVFELFVVANDLFSDIFILILYEQEIKLHARHSLLDVEIFERLRWFGRVERKDDNDWVERCTTWEVEGIRPIDLVGLC